MLRRLGWIAGGLLLLLLAIPPSHLLPDPPAESALPPAPGAIGFAYALSLPQAPPSDLALHLISTTPSAVVTVNGQVFYRRATPGGPYALIRAIPILLPLPATLLRPGENRVEIEVGGLFAPPGAAPRIFVGPEASLRLPYGIAWLLLERLPLVFLSAGLVLGTVLVLLWAGRRQDRASLAMAVLLLLGTGRAVGFLTPDLAMPPGLIRLGNGLGIVQIALLPACVLVFLGRRPPPWLWLPPIAAALFAAALATPAGAEFRPPLPIILVFAVLCLMLATGLVAKAFVRDRSTESLLLLVACVTNLVGVLVFVWGKLSGTEAVTAYGPGGQGLAVGLPMLGLFLVLRWAAAARALDRANDHLAEELRRAEALLTETLGQQHAQAQRLLLQAERERLMHELHDGVSGRLISAVASCAMRGEAFQEVEGTLRDTLGELRLVITAMQDFEGDLAQAIGSFVPQLQRQVRPLGVTLDAEIADLPPLPWLRPAHVQHVLRIVQEAVMNAARHSGAGRVRIEAAADVARITVRDAGRGGVQDRDGSYGLRSMRRRAEALGAGLHIVSDADGTAVVLELPTAVPAATAAA
ncbi:MAG: sensor histidine kinase [Paracraurococcus sp.]